MNLGEILLYRVTHIENIPHILKNGITHRKSPNANPNYKPIGDASLIDKRKTRSVCVDNGETITLGDFIPFYFGTRMPMLYVIQNGFNHTTEVPARNIVYIIIKLQNVIDNTPSDKYYFSDGHATDKLTMFYCSDNVRRLPLLIDWDAVNAKYWGGGDNDTKRAKQAEFLIKGDVAPSHILKFGCYNKKARDELLSMGLNEDRIQIMAEAYYD